VDVTQWDDQYVGDYGDRLASINEVTHHMVIVGYLDYGAKAPAILDVGCGNERLLQMLADFGFDTYVGIDWSAQAIRQAESLSIPHTKFEVANMDGWETANRFDAVVLNESLYYSAVEPRVMFERSLGWWTEDGIAIVSMFRNLGSRYIWSRIQSTGVEQVAACAVKEDATGKVWEVRAYRPAASAKYPPDGIRLCPCARGARTPASNRGAASRLPAPRGSGGCGVLGSLPVWHPLPSR
jgi:SAM-dependent methyltransferase